MTKVDITTAGHTITIEADDPLNEVAAKALQLWHDTRDPRIDRAWSATGFSAERSSGEYVSNLDATLGRHG